MGFKFILHVFTAVFALLTLVLPFLGLTLSKLYRIQVIMRVNSLIKLIRLQNIMLLVTVISGFLIWGSFSFNWWLMTVLVFSIIYGAVLSFMVKSLKNVKEQADNNTSYDVSIGQFIKWSTINSIIIIALFTFKLYI